MWTFGGLWHGIVHMFNDVVPVDELSLFCVVPAEDAGFLVLSRWRRPFALETSLLFIEKGIRRGAYHVSKWSKL
ncbi:hypothetical protein CDEF62S_00015 [Castellaniella defragrans]